MNFTNEQINKFITDNRESFLQDLAELIAIPSVEGIALPGAPFGEQAALALNKSLDIARGFGLNVQNCDGYIGFAEIKGEKERQIATIAHIDVVPEGNGWTQNPYEMKIKDGYLLGRGVIDDKGPAMVTLYVAKFFKELGLPLPYTLRILIGASEETDMSDVDYYVAKYGQPAFCMTPDGNFPVCYGEKGIFSGDFATRFKSDVIVDFCGGIASNVIPDRAYAIVKADISTLSNAENITVVNENGLVKISAQGVGGHAAHPDGTVNAIGLIVKYLLANNLVQGDEKQFMLFLSDLFSNPNGSHLGIDSDDGMFTPLTCIGGMISCKNGIILQNINIRFPTSTSADKITCTLKQRANLASTDFIAGKSMEPFLVDPKSEVIKTLTSVYNTATSQNLEPFTMGGGTYARHFENAVSFGVEDENANYPSFVGPMHGADEGVPLDLLLKTMEIYIIAIGKLMELDL